MSTRLLLPCSPPPHRTSPADHPVAPLSRPPPLISLGSFSSYTACQGPSKAPLLKSRRCSPQPLVVPHSPSENSLSFPSAGVGLHLREASAPFREVSPTRQVLLPLETSPAKEVCYQPPRKSFLAPHSKIAPNKTFSESSSSPSPLSPLSPASPGVPTFPCRLPSPSTHAPKAPLRKSQSALIMPSLLTLLRPDPVPGAASSAPKSDAAPSFPSPLIRKCHTMVALSAASSGGAALHPPSGASTSTRVVKEKRPGPRFGFFRRISASKSAVFASSPSKAAGGAAGLRRSPSAALHRYRRGAGAQPGEGRPAGSEEAEEHRHFQARKTLREREALPPSPTEEERVGWSASGGCSRCTSATSLPSRRQSTVITDAVFCKLCLTDVSVRETYQLQQCQCRFCTYCMCMYATLKIREGELAIECPDSNCDCRGELTLEEVESLVGKELLNLHLRFRRDREIEANPLKTWCPKPGCDTVIRLSVSKLDGRPQCCSCPSCNTLFCGSCSSPWHPAKPCNHIVAQLLGVPLNDAIKRCPRCKVPIERDAGCAQMQCKKCKHVFCWYCLASLEDDFLLRHYDKGPCKNKLGHSRASVLWHRAQVVVIFAGFGLLLVIASPLLLFVGPCLLCRSCRPCSSSSSSGSSSRPDFEEEENAGI